MNLDDVGVMESTKKNQKKSKKMLKYGYFVAVPTHHVLRSSCQLVLNGKITPHG